MLSPLELTIIATIALGVAWWWHIHGQRDYALQCIKTHCQKLNLTLLDGYVALKRITLKRDERGYLRLARIYSFEFTVTGEQRYTGYITLFGYYVSNIELPPYPFDPQRPPKQDNSLESHPSSSIISLENYRKHGKTNEND